jgi:hypothetical protein
MASPSGLPRSVASIAGVARGRGADRGPNGQAACPEGEREAGAGVHERGTISSAGDLPGPHVRPAAPYRAGELAGIRYDARDPRRSDLDLWSWEITVRGKGKERVVKIGHEAARALDRYLRVRSRHAQAWRPQLWLGVNNRGPMTANGIYQMSPGGEHSAAWMP